MKSENWLIVELGAALLVLALLSFFFTPAYEKSAWFITGVIASQFANVIGYKFGRSMPQQASDPKASQKSASETKISTETEPEVIIKPQEPPA